MNFAREELSNIRMSNEKENKSITKIYYNKNDSISISVKSQITIGSSRVISVRPSRKNNINRIQHSLSSTFLLSSKNTLYIKNKLFPNKDNNDFYLLFLTEKNENKVKEEKKEVKHNKEAKEDKENKHEIKENKIDIKEEGIKNNNINNIKANELNKNACLKNVENNSTNKNLKINIDMKRGEKKNYMQIYNRNDLSGRLP